MNSEDVDWRQAACEIIGHIADEQYQRENWFGQGRFISEPTEMYNEVFDDLALEDVLVSHKYGLTDIQQKAGWAFIEAMNAFERPIDELTTVQIIDHPMWREIRRTARAFVDALGGDCGKTTNS